MKKKLLSFTLAAIMTLNPMFVFAEDVEPTEEPVTVEESTETEESTDETEEESDVEESEPVEESQSQTDKLVEEGALIPVEETTLINVVTGEEVDLTQSEEKEEVEEKKDTYVVTFIDSIDESTISEVTVEEGSDAALPEAPTHEGYFFKEWEGNYTNVVSDETVTAIYEEQKDTDKLVYTELNLDLDRYSVLVIGQMPEGTNLLAKVVDSSEAEEKVTENLSAGVEFKAEVTFDIKLLYKGEEYQPTEFGEEVTVSITGVDSTKEFDVYRITEDDVVTDMNATNSGDMVEFDTDHFTTYTIGGMDYDSETMYLEYDPSGYENNMIKAYRWNRQDEWSSPEKLYYELAMIFEREFDDTTNPDAFYFDEIYGPNGHVAPNTREVHHKYVMKMYWVSTLEIINYEKLNPDDLENKTSEAALYTLKLGDTYEGRGLQINGQYFAGGCSNDGWKIGPWLISLGGPYGQKSATYINLLSKLSSAAEYTGPRSYTIPESEINKIMEQSSNPYGIPLYAEYLFREARYAFILKNADGTEICRYFMNPSDVTDYKVMLNRFRPDPDAIFVAEDGTTETDMMDANGKIPFQYDDFIMTVQKPTQNKWLGMTYTTSDEDGDGVNETLTLSGTQTEAFTDPTNCPFATDENLTTIKVAPGTKLINCINLFSISNTVDHKSTNIKTIDITGADTSEVEDFSGMFRRMHYTEIKGLDTLDTSSAKDMSGMFYQFGMNSDAHISSLDLSSWDTSNVTSMGQMFYYAQIDNLNLSSWNISKVTRIASMFDHTGFNTFKLDISGWNIDDSNNIEGLNNYGLTGDESLLSESSYLEELKMCSTKDISQAIKLNVMPTFEGYGSKGWMIDDNNDDKADDNKLYSSIKIGETAAHTYKRAIKIDFDSNGGSEVSPQVVAYYTNKNAMLQTPEAPTKDNSIFAGWYFKDTYTNADKKLADFANPNASGYAGHSPLVAKWTAAHTHTPATPVKENVVEATCQADGGYDEVVRCSTCNEIISSTYHSVEKTDHVADTPVISDKVEADCKEAGHHTETVKCKLCGTILSTKVVTDPAKGHAPIIKKENIKESTYTEAGSYEEVKYCKECGIELTRETKVIPKKEKSVEKTPTVNDTSKPVSPKEEVPVEKVDIISKTPEKETENKTVIDLGSTVVKQPVEKKKTEVKPIVIKGRVVDDEGVAISNATVTVSTITGIEYTKVQTDTKGYYEFEVAKIESFTISATYSGYNDNSIVYLAVVTDEQLQDAEDIILTLKDVDTPTTASDEGEADEVLVEKSNELPTWFFMILVLILLIVAAVAYKKYRNSKES